MNLDFNRLAKLFCGRNCGCTRDECGYGEEGCEFARLFFSSHSSTQNSRVTSPWDSTAFVKQTAAVH